MFTVNPIRTLNMGQCYNFLKANRHKPGLVLKVQVSAFEMRHSFYSKTFLYHVTGGLGLKYKKH